MTPEDSAGRAMPHFSETGCSNTFLAIEVMKYLCTNLNSATLITI